MTKTKSKPKQDNSKTFFMAVMSGLAISTLVFAWLFVSEKNSQQPINVNLGIFGYELKNGTYVERSDAKVNNFNKFLVDAAKKDLSLGCKSAFYHVISVNKNEDQALLEYGCEYPSARMFAVEKNGAWEFISPTNNFTNQGIPSCSYLDQHGIGSEVAPVCANINNPPDVPDTYEVR